MPDVTLTNAATGEQRTITFANPPSQADIDDADKQIWATAPNVPKATPAPTPTPVPIAPPVAAPSMPTAPVTPVAAASAPTMTVTPPGTNLQLPTAPPPLAAVPRALDSQYQSDVKSGALLKNPALMVKYNAALANGTLTPQFSQGDSPTLDPGSMVGLDLDGKPRIQAYPDTDQATGQPVIRLKFTTPADKDVYTRQFLTPAGLTLDGTGRVVSPKEQAPNIPGLGNVYGTSLLGTQSSTDLGTEMTTPELGGRGYAPQLMPTAPPSSNGQGKAKPLPDSPLFQPAAQPLANANLTTGSGDVNDTTGQPNIAGQTQWPTTVDAYMKKWLAPGQVSAPNAMLDRLVQDVPRSQWATTLDGYSDVGRAALISAANRQLAARVAAGETLKSTADKSLEPYMPDPNDTPAQKFWNALAFGQENAGGLAVTPQQVEYAEDALNRQVTSAREFTGRSPAESFAAPLVGDPASMVTDARTPGLMPALRSGLQSWTIPSNALGAAAMGEASAAIGGGAAVTHALTAAFGAQALPEIVRRVKANDYSGAFGEALLAISPEIIHYGAPLVGGAVNAGAESIAAKSASAENTAVYRRWVDEIGDRPFPGYEGADKPPPEYGGYFPNKGLLGAKDAPVVTPPPTTATPPEMGVPENTAPSTPAPTGSAGASDAPSTSSVKFGKKPVQEPDQGAYAGLPSQIKNLDASPTSVFVLTQHLAGLINKMKVGLITPADLTEEDLNDFRGITSVRVRTLLDGIATTNSNGDAIDLKPWAAFRDALVQETRARMPTLAVGDEFKLPNGSMATLHSVDPVSGTLTMRFEDGSVEGDRISRIEDVTRKRVVAPAETQPLQTAPPPPAITPAGQATPVLSAPIPATPIEPESDIARQAREKYGLTTTAEGVPANANPATTSATTGNGPAVAPVPGSTGQAAGRPNVQPADQHDGQREAGSGVRADTGEVQSSGAGTNSGTSEVVGGEGGSGSIQNAEAKAISRVPGVDLTNPENLSPKAQDFAKAWHEAANGAITPAQAEMAAIYANAHAQRWAYYTGGTPDEWFDSRIAMVRNGLAKQVDDEMQTGQNAPPAPDTGHAATDLPTGADETTPDHKNLVRRNSELLAAESPQDISRRLTGQPTSTVVSELNSVPQTRVNELVNDYVARAQADPSIVSNIHQHLYTHENALFESLEQGLSTPHDVKQAQYRASQVNIARQSLAKMGVDPDSLPNREANLSTHLMNFAVQSRRNGGTHSGATNTAKSLIRGNVPVDNSATTGQPDSTTPQPGTLHQSAASTPQNAQDPLGFYSHAESVVMAKMGGKMPADMLGRMLLANGVKPDELKYTGLGDFLATRGSEPVTRGEVMGHLNDNKIGLTEVVKGVTPPTKSAQERRDVANAELDRFMNQAMDQHGMRPSAWPSSVQSEYARRLAARDAITDDTKPDMMGAPEHEQYQLPGGSNYKEHLLTLPHNDVNEAWSKVDAIARNHGISADGAATIRPRFESGDGNLSDFDGIPELKKAISDASAMGSHNEPYTHTHWPGEKNVVAHFRTNDRVGPNGEKLLHVEEVQSDWHQIGRKEGYRDDRSVEEAKKRTETTGAKLLQITRDKDDAFKANDYEKYDRLVDAEIEARQENAQAQSDWYARSRARVGKVPDAPFKTTWHELALRRVLRHAAENGYDAVSWTPGTDQADRYNLAKHVSKISYQPGTQELTVYPHNQPEPVVQKIAPDKLADHVGQEVAQKLLVPPTATESARWDAARAGLQKYLETATGYDQNHPAVKEHIAAQEGGIRRTVEGDDLSSGGSGMRAFYDRMVPDYLNKFGKRFGAKVGTTEIDTPGSAMPGEKAMAWAVRLSDGKIWQTYPSEKAAQSGLRDLESFSPKLFKAGAEVVLNNATKTVPSIPITPEMRQHLTEQGTALFQRGKGKGKNAKLPRAQVTFLKDGRAIIEAMKNPDFSSGFHEVGHIGRRDIYRDIDAPSRNGSPGGNGFTRADWEHVEEWCGVKNQQAWRDGTYDPDNDDAEEKFNAGYDNYIYTDKAPTPGLERVFAALKAWMLKTFKGIPHPEINLSPQMRDIYARLLGRDIPRPGEAVPEATAAPPDGSAPTGTQEAQPATGETSAADSAPTRTPRAEGEDFAGSTNLHHIDADDATMQKYRDDAEAAGYNARGKVSHDELMKAAKAMNLTVNQLRGLTAGSSLEVKHPNAGTHQAIRTLAVRMLANELERQSVVHQKAYADAKTPAAKAKALTELTRVESDRQVALQHAQELSESSGRTLNQQKIDAEAYQGPQAGTSADKVISPEKGVSAPARNAQAYGKRNKFTTDRAALIAEIANMPVPDESVPDDVFGDAATSSQSEEESGHDAPPGYKSPLDSALDREDEEYERGNALHQSAAPEVARQKQTDTPEFKRWFGKSKVVGTDGQSKVVYHGTSNSGFTSFDKEKIGQRNLFGPGFYFTENPDISSEYTQKGVIGDDSKGQGVYPVHLRIEKPFDGDKGRVTVLGDDYKDRRVDYATLVREYGGKGQAAKILKAKGYDGITHEGGHVLGGGRSVHRVWVAFEPNQVKSAIGNNGDFSRSDANILHQSAAPQPYHEALTKLGAFHLEAGTRTYKPWAAAMQADLKTAGKPPASEGDMQIVYRNAKNYLSQQYKAAGGSGTKEEHFIEQVGQMIGSNEGAASFVNKVAALTNGPDMLARYASGGSGAVTDAEEAQIARALRESIAEVVADRKANPNTSRVQPILDLRAAATAQRKAEVTSGRAAKEAAAKAIPPPPTAHEAFGKSLVRSYGEEGASAFEHAAGPDLMDKLAFGKARTAAEDQQLLEAHDAGMSLKVPRKAAQTNVGLKGIHDAVSDSEARGRAATEAAKVPNSPAAAQQFEKDMIGKYGRVGGRMFMNGVRDSVMPKLLAGQPLTAEDEAVIHRMDVHARQYIPAPVKRSVNANAAIVNRIAGEGRKAAQQTERAAKAAAQTPEETFRASLTRYNDKGKDAFIAALGPAMTRKLAAGETPTKAQEQWVLDAHNAAMATKTPILPKPAPGHGTMIVRSIIKEAQAAAKKAANVASGKALPTDTLEDRYIASIAPSMGGVKGGGAQRFRAAIGEPLLTKLVNGDPMTPAEMRTIGDAKIANTPARPGRQTQAKENTDALINDRKANIIAPHELESARKTLRGLGADARKAAEQAKLKTLAGAKQVRADLVANAPIDKATGLISEPWLKRLTADMAAAGDDPRKLANLHSRYVASFGKNYQAYAVNNLISGTSTAERVLISNLLAPITEEASRTFAAPVSKGTVHPPNLRAMGHAYGKAITKGIPEAARIMRYGETGLTLAGENQFAQPGNRLRGEFSLPDKAGGKVLNPLFRATPRLHGAMGHVSSVYGYERGMADAATAEAGRQADAAGLKGRARAKAVRAAVPGILGAPTDDMKAYASDYGNQLANRQPNRLSDEVERFASRFGKEGKVVKTGLAPIMKVPLNLGLRQGQTTFGPLTMLHQGARLASPEYNNWAHNAFRPDDERQPPGTPMSEEQRRSAAMAFGRGALGLAVGAAGILGHRAGVVNPPDDKQYDEGSIHMFGHDYNNRWMYPLAGPLMAGATLDKMGYTNPDAYEQIVKSYFRDNPLISASGALGAAFAPSTPDGERAFYRAVAGLLAEGIPFEAAVREVAATYDPTGHTRTKKSIMDNVKDDIPGPAGRYGLPVSPRLDHGGLFSAVRQVR